MDKQLHLSPIGMMSQRLVEKKVSYRGMDIALLKANSFLINAKRQETIIGYTSLYKLKRLIKNRKKPILKNNKKIIKRLIQKKLPIKYKKYKNIFLKTILDILPPYQEKVNYNIILKEDNTLSPNPLYNISLDQLEIVKNYLKNHFNKNFIIHNDVLYASPILFAKKL